MARARLLRTVSVATLALGLVPGMTTGLLPQALGSTAITRNIYVGIEYGF